MERYKSSFNTSFSPIGELLRNSQFIILNSQLLPQTFQQNYVWFFLYSRIGNAEEWVKMDEIIRFLE